VRRGYRWFHRAAHILKNQAGLPGTPVRRRMRGLLAAVGRGCPQGRIDETLASATRHFLKVSASYWPGLFHCYDVPGLPRTNNDLEHLFGSNRYHERRATGRKVASPAMVLRGPVRLLAATATRVKPFLAQDLALADVGAWRELRAGLDQRRAARALRRRFRRNPDHYLRQVEHELLQSTLPP
jgi:hypothetical protein